MKTSSRRRSTDLDKAIGANLRRIRIERGMSQEGLSALLDLTFQQVQKYEKGTNAIASSRVPRICQALRIAPADLFGGTLDGMIPEAVVPMSVAAARMAAEINELSPKAQKVMAAVIDLVGGL